MQLTQLYHHAICEPHEKLELCNLLLHKVKYICVTNEEPNLQNYDLYHAHVWKINFPPYKL
jgi:hypothetical protein